MGNVQIDLEEWVLEAAVMKMDDPHQTHESYYISKAFEKLYPEVGLVKRVRKQVKEYKKLTMWR